MGRTAHLRLPSTGDTLSLMNRGMPSWSWCLAGAAVLVSACSGSQPPIDLGGSGSGASGGASPGAGAVGGTGATSTGGTGVVGSGGSSSGGTGVVGSGGSSSGGTSAGMGTGGSAAPGSGGTAASGGAGTGASAGTSARAGAPGAGGAAGTAGMSMAGAGTTGGAAGTGGTSGGATTSPGCGSTNTTSPCGTKGTQCSLDVGGTMRTYYVQLPADYDASTPHRLIFQYHPWGGSADQALTMYRLNSGIPDAIYVTPQGLDAGGSGPGWANTNGQDIDFTKAMLADVEGKYCVDETRIFSVGFSYGGMMSFALACDMSDVFRAVAPMSGALYSEPRCKGTGPHVAMWGSHGLSDTVVPIDDGRAARDKVLQQNHCGTTTTPVDPSPCVKYEGCDPGYDVTWCEWDGPHGIPSFGSSAITAFFKQF